MNRIHNQVSSLATMIDGQRYFSTRHYRNNGEGHSPFKQARIDCSSLVKELAEFDFFRTGTSRIDRLLSQVQKQLAKSSSVRSWGEHNEHLAKAARWAALAERAAR